MTLAVLQPPVIFPAVVGLGRHWITLEAELISGAEAMPVVNKASDNEAMCSMVVWARAPIAVACNQGVGEAAPEVASRVQFPTQPTKVSASANNIAWPFRTVKRVHVVKKAHYQCGLFL